MKINKILINNYTNWKKDIIIEDGKKYNINDQKKLQFKNFGGGKKYGT